MEIVDARGELCPKPVIMTKKVLDSIEEGKVETIVDNEVAKSNLQKLAESSGCQSEVNQVSEKEIHVIITKTKDTVKQVEEDGAVLLIGTDTYGKVEELGKILMKSFLYTVAETKPYPKTILLYNAAVKLACTGSDSLDDLKSLSENGVEIISCGTCLDYFNIKDKLEVGIIGNMYAIYEAASRSKNTISIG